MTELLILFPADADQQELDEVVRGLVKNLKQSSGLRSLSVSQGDVRTADGSRTWSRLVHATLDEPVNWLDRLAPPEREAERDAFRRLGPTVISYEASEQSS